MISTILHILDITLWIIMAFSVAYVAFYAIVSTMKPPKKTRIKTGKDNKFLVLFPAYNEDNVIIDSVSKFLHQDYPNSHYQVAVISDHMTEATNESLRKLPITLLTPTFDKSTKAKALQYSIANINGNYDYVIIMDADNIVDTDFLKKVNISCNQGNDAIQCHRCAKNKDTEISSLDGISEEINNSIFRKAHNNIGMSSALIGSGMCLKYSWFTDNVNKLTTAGEDKEIEALLLLNGIFIKYEENIHVYDEKISDMDNFQRQRQRWISAQINNFINMLEKLPHAIIKCNINYIDKTIQQALIPRSMLILSVLFMSIITTFLDIYLCSKWWALFIIISFSLFIAIPTELRKGLPSKIFTAIKLILLMFKSTAKVKIGDNDFLHTSHSNSKNVNNK